MATGRRRIDRGVYNSSLRLRRPDLRALASIGCPIRPPEIQLVAKSVALCDSLAALVLSPQVEAAPRRAQSRAARLAPGPAGTDEAAERRYFAPSNPRRGGRRQTVPVPPSKRNSGGLPKEPILKIGMFPLPAAIRSCSAVAVAAVENRRLEMSRAQRALMLAPLRGRVIVSNSRNYRPCSITEGIIERLVTRRGIPRR